jgi:hypothetical protein
LKDGGELGEGLVGGTGFDNGLDNGLDNGFDDGLDYEGSVGYASPSRASFSRQKGIGVSMLDRECALYSPTTGDTALRNGRHLPPKTMGVVTEL